jgi:signal peptidase II
MQKGQDSGHPEKSDIFLGKNIRRAGVFLTSAALVVALDQVSKFWIRANVPPTASLQQTGFLHIVYIKNFGAAFALPANQTFLLIVTSIAILLIIILFSYYLFAHYRSPVTTLSSISLGLILGGAIGNLIERLQLGYVTDFIDLHLWGIFHWPAFNLADAAIVIGIFTFIYSLYRSGLFRKVYEHDRKTGI